MYIKINAMIGRVQHMKTCTAQSHDSNDQTSGLFRRNKRLISGQTD